MLGHFDILPYQWFINTCTLMALYILPCISTKYALLFDHTNIIRGRIELK